SMRSRTVTPGWARAEGAARDAASSAGKRADRKEIMIAGPPLLSQSVLNLPGAIRLAAGSAISLLAAALDIHCLRIFAAGQVVLLIGGLRCHRAVITRIRITPLDRLARATILQRIIGRLAHIGAVGAVE